LEKVLEAVCALAENEEPKATPQLPVLIDVLNKPESGLERCRETLQSLKSNLESSRGQSRVSRLIWPLHEGDVRKALDYFANFQRLLESAMHIDHAYVRFLNFKMMLNVLTDA
jgi:hypothetical protein